MALKVNSEGKLIVDGDGKLTCTCCPCPTTTLLCATASASKTKTGYAELGTASDPPEIYLQYVYSYTQRLAQCSGTGCDPDELVPVNTVTETVTGVYNPATGLTTRTGSDQTVTYGCEGVVSDITTPISDSYAGTAVPNPCSLVPTGGTCTTVSPTSKTYSTPEYGCGESQPDQDVNGSLTLSVPYTTPDLIDAMLAAIGTPGTLSACGTIIIASFSLSSDELTASGKAGAYAFAIPGDAPACYKITWDEVVTTNGTPAVTPKEYTWDGSATQSPTINVAVPGDNTATGLTTVTVTIENIVVTCTGCA